MPLKKHFGFPKEIFSDQFLKEALFSLCKEHIYDPKNIFPL